jgi:DNA-directed RNA polymerase III subunit RPC5
MADYDNQSNGNDGDEIISTMPIHYSTSMDPHVHLHQFPLLTRRLMVPPKAAASGKRIRARVKPGVHRTEIHVPADTRPDVWNAERGNDLGQARLADDRERNQDIGFAKHREGDDVRLSEVRLASERVPHVGVYMLGVVREGVCRRHILSCQLC